MLAIYSSVIILVVALLLCMRRFRYKSNYYLTDPSYFLGSYFTETLFFFLTMIEDVTSVAFVSY